MYDLFEHRHRFSVWAAARAAQRGWTSVDVLRDALEDCGVVQFVKDTVVPITDTQFSQFHRDWCNSIIREVAGGTYGRAAKLIAVYLKSMIVLGREPQNALAAVVHPPIDSILLRNISDCPEIHSSEKAQWRKVKWTQLNEQKYFKLLDELRQTLSDGEPFWMLERFWTVTEERFAQPA